MKAKMITYKGKTQTTKQWSEETGIPVNLILDRLQKRLSVEEALSYPPKQRRDIKYEYNGELYSIPELARLHGSISPATMRQRLYAGMTVEEAMAKPNSRPGRKQRITEAKQKEVFMPVKRPKKIDTTQCKTCQYCGSLGNSKLSGVFCAYSLITKHCRQFISPPSPNCTVYVRGKSLYRQTVLKEVMRGAII